MARKFLLNIVWFTQKPFARILTSEYSEVMCGPNVIEHVLQTEINVTGGGPMRTRSLGAVPDELVVKLHESAVRYIQMWCRRGELWGSINLSVYVASCGYSCECPRLDEASRNPGITMVTVMARMDDIANIVYDQL